jgi:hypothetical protein
MPDYSDNYPEAVFGAQNVTDWPQRDDRLRETPQDPISRVHDALVELAAASPALKALFTESNWPLIKSDADVRFPNVSQAGDLPVLSLVPVSGFMQAVRDSHKGTITKRWNWGVFTGDKRPVGNLFKLEWELYRAMANWKTTFDESLQWNGNPIVFDVSLTEYQESYDEKKRPPGWNGLLTCEVEMVFDRARL